MHRFFSPHTDLNLNVVCLTDPAEIHHLSHVLRLKKDDRVGLFNGQGQEAEGAILSITKRGVEIRILSRNQKSRVPPTTFVIACAIPKKGKFELIVEKCTELGIHEIIPLETARTEVRLSGEKAKARVERYRKIAINAAKQSQRALLPVIHPVSSLDGILKSLQPTDQAFIPCLTGKRENLLDVLPGLPKAKRIVFFIGPEGDFTPEEIEQARGHGCRPLSLGPHVLKVDTAAFCVASALHLLSKRDD